MSREPERFFSCVSEVMVYVSLRNKRWDGAGQRRGEAEEAKGACFVVSEGVGGLYTKRETQRKREKKKEEREREKSKRKEVERIYTFFSSDENPSAQPVSGRCQGVI